MKTRIAVPLLTLTFCVVPFLAGKMKKIGREVAIPLHLQDGEEFELSIRDLASFGQKLFTAMWTSQEGAGRPLTKGTGNPLSDPTSPLVFPRNFNRVSGPDTNSCSGCNNKPYIGGGGDIVGNGLINFGAIETLHFCCWVVVQDDPAFPPSVVCRSTLPRTSNASRQPGGHP